MNMRSSTEEVEQYEDAGDRLSVKDKEKRAKSRDERKLDGLKQIMASPNGRLWMWDFLSSCGLFSVVFNGNSKDYFNLGQRNAAMPTFSDIQKHCMNDYMTMVKESANV
jgi:hypothetical protein